MTPLAQAISEALLQFLWQGLLVALLVSVTLYLLRNRGPNIRYLVCCIALLACAALPVITAIALYDPLSGVQAGPAATTLTIRAAWNGSVSPIALYLERAIETLQPSLQAWMLRVWILGVAFFSLRLAWLGVHVSKLRRTASPAAEKILTAAKQLSNRMGMRRAVRVLVSAIPDGPGVIGPSVIGWFRPVILLPAASILHLTPDELEAILIALEEQSQKTFDQFRTRTT